MISVVVPTYNGLEMLRKSLPTWFEQTLPKEEYEIIVVDNRSTDDTRQYVESLLPKQKNLIYIYEPKSGATNARHAGAHRAKGEYLVFADNDGLFNTRCLDSILEVYRDNKDCEAVACKIDIQWDKTEPTWIQPYLYLLGQLNYGVEVNYSTSYYLNGGLMSIKKDVFEQLGGFNPDLIGPYLIGDGDLGLVKKLHKNKMLIGWAPNAHMWHMQKVEKHGSEKGIALHYYNNGIADSYAEYRKQGFDMNWLMWKYLCVKTLVVIKKIFEFILLPNKRYRYFLIKQYQGNIRFFALLLNSQLRKEIEKQDVYHI